MRQKISFSRSLLFSTAIFFLSFCDEKFTVTEKQETRSILRLELSRQFTYYYDDECDLV
jgi:hypothetical protein